MCWVKDLKTGEWFSCNDSNKSELSSAKDIAEKGYLSADIAGTGSMTHTPYFLVYVERGAAEQEKQQLTQSEIERKL